MPVFIPGGSNEFDVTYRHADRRKSSAVFQERGAVIEAFFMNGGSGTVAEIPEKIGIEIGEQDLRGILSALECHNVIHESKGVWRLGRTKFF